MFSKTTLNKQFHVNVHHTSMASVDIELIQSFCTDTMLENEYRAAAGNGKLEVP